MGSSYDEAIEIQLEQDGAVDHSNACAVAGEEVMRVLDRQRRQQAVYWGAPQSDGRGSQTFGTPIQLLVRWEAKMQTIVDHEGQTTMSSANVTVSDQQHIDNNGFMWLGTLATIPGGLGANPEHIAGAARIKNVSDNPDIRGRRILRKVYVA